MNVFQVLADACGVSYTDAKRMFYATVYSRNNGQHDSHFIDWLFRIVERRK